jgi:TonB family protein
MISLTLIGKSQNDPNVVEFFDKDWNTTKNVKEAAYYRTIDEHNGKYLVRDFYGSNDSIQMEGLCSSVHPKLVFDGQMRWFYENGAIERTGFYKNHEEMGLHRSYFKDGKPKSEILYRNKKQLYCQQWSEAGTPLLLNGSGLVIIAHEDPTHINYLEIKDSLALYAYSISIERDTVYTLAEKPTEYKGGFPVFYKGLANDMIYPRQARRDGIEGRVYVEFIVDEKGIPGSARVVKGIGGGCDQVALEACIKQKKWIPGRVKGKPVKTRLVLPVIFKLS